MYWAIKFKAHKGYHSIYSNRARALKAFKFYNKEYPGTYFLKKVIPDQLGKNWWHKNMVRFKDSSGWLNVIEGE